LKDKPSLEELHEVQGLFDLPSLELVEKDWHGVRALAAIAAVDTEPLRLVFGGGTALSRAHGLIQRMSEDIDFKIVSDDRPSQGALRSLRKTITDALLGAGFVFDPNPGGKHIETAHQRTFTRYQLPYEAIVKGQGVLRPDIQIETSVWPMRRPAIDKMVRSFVAEGLGRPAEVATIACATVPENAAEKLVALTRRAGAELAGLRKDKGRDLTLVRHVYDLHLIRGEYDAGDVAILARDIMVDEAQNRAEDFPAYQASPLAETVKAIEGIAADAAFAKGYEDFCRDMVYGEKPDFETAITTLKLLGKHLEAA
jgi:hypothetical protein